MYFLSLGVKGLNELQKGTYVNSESNEFPFLREAVVVNHKFWPRAIDFGSRSNRFVNCSLSIQLACTNLHFED